MITIPSRALRICNKTGCNQLTRERFCDAHQGVLKEQHREYKRRRTDHDEQAFYKSAAWRKLRMVKLRLDPLCEECLRNGDTTPADMVDHVTPIKSGGARLDITNLQSLCFACHNRKTASERT